MAAAPTEHACVWYVAYGSNLSATRFASYLQGGRPAGALRTYPGARDRRPPVATRPVRLPGGVYFAGESRVWTGGMAFLDLSLPSTVAARAYLLSRSQFADVAGQEMHRDPGVDLDLDLVLDTGCWSYGPGRYETVHRLGDLDGIPMLTLTAPWSSEDVRPADPSAAYLRVIAHGLAEAHGWEEADVARYLRGLPGIRPTWSDAGLRALSAGSGPVGPDRHLGDEAHSASGGPPPRGRLQR